MYGRQSIDMTTTLGNQNLNLSGLRSPLHFSASPDPEASVLASIASSQTQQVDLLPALARKIQDNINLLNAAVANNSQHMVASASLDQASQLLIQQLLEAQQLLASNKGLNLFRLKQQQQQHQHEERVQRHSCATQPLSLPSLNQSPIHSSSPTSSPSSSNSPSLNNRAQLAKDLHQHLMCQKLQQQLSGHELKSNSDLLDHAFATPNKPLRVQTNFKRHSVSVMEPNGLAPQKGAVVTSLIESESIMGFNVSGEKRLCLPHLLRFVLNDVEIKEIEKACIQLQISCTECTVNQLVLLRNSGSLPKDVKSCGLMRKSDAERLVKYLRTQKREQVYSDHSDCSDSDADSQASSNEMDRLVIDVVNEPKARRVDSNLVEVTHRCFGRQRGTIHLDLYTGENAACIQCRSCRCFFSPPQFVGHTHALREVNQLSHWGFDSANWRCYLRLHSTERRQDTRNDDHKKLESFKIKFLKVSRHSSDMIINKVFFAAQTSLVLRSR
ncbi:hypothetical protein Ciccas_004787 [Cichlidogyrus casuarinus]|uniref:c-SKI SMAD4-binding domain-containing protein n=1 Tax=Cichlidogyrus casuarinus TaxID=1844966 RepID=A0ABD2QAH5_9PLAT